MNPILTAILVLAAIGAVLAVLLCIAAKYMHVPTTGHFDEIRSCLPGANCGGCGYAGCDGYASALDDGSETVTNKCTAGGSEVSKKLAELTGAEFLETERRVAFVTCRGSKEVTGKLGERIGEKSCRAAGFLYGGNGACRWGCLSYGDCAAACPQSAIRIVNGVAHVDPALCVGCGKCAEVCPQKIIKMVKKDYNVRVTCSNHDKGAVTRKICSAGCIGCGLCERNCPNDAIHVIDGLAIVDENKCKHCDLCVSKCPVKCIQDEGLLGKI